MSNLGKAKSLAINCAVAVIVGWIAVSATKSDMDRNFLSGVISENYLIKSLQNEITGLKTQNTLLDNRIKASEDNISKLQQSSFEAAIHNKIGFFSPDDTKFRVIDTDYGAFLVSIENIEKYANGYKLSLAIGNPYLVTFQNVKMNIYWGRDYSKSPATSDDKDKGGNLTDTILQPILPGRWNHVTTLISPASEKTIESISITLEPSTVSLMQ